MNKKLEPGVTQIGITNLLDEDGVLIQYENGKFDFNILYGNILTPFVNGEILHLPPDYYKTKLYDFLNTEEGQKYDMPTEEEIRNASAEMLRREQAFKKDMLKKAEQKTPEVTANAEDVALSTPDTKQTAISKDIEDGHGPARNVHQESKMSEEITVQNIPSAFTSDQVYKFIQADRLNEQIAELNKDNNELKVQAHKRKISVTVIAILLIMSLLVNGIMLHRYITDKLHGVDYAEMNINGIKYEVPIANVEVADGQKKIMIYGFTVTNENGKLKNVAVPLGEFVIGD